MHRARPAAYLTNLSLALLSVYMQARACMHAQLRATCARLFMHESIERMCMPDKTPINRGTVAIPLLRLSHETVSLPQPLCQVVCSYANFLIPLQSDQDQCAPSTTSN